MTYNNKLPKEKLFLWFIFLMVFVLNKSNARDYKQDGICDTKINISEEILIIFKCDQWMNAEYRENPESYYADIQKIESDLRKITEDPVIYCQVLEVTQTPNFSVQLVNTVSTESDLTKEVKFSIAGQYSADTNILELPTLVTKNKNNDARQRTIFHEFHHAYMRARNRHLTINGVLKQKNGQLNAVTMKTKLMPDQFESSVKLLHGRDSLFYWSSFPGKSINNLQELKNTFALITQRLEKYIYILRENKSKMSIDHASQEILKNLLVISQQYVPYQHRFPVNKNYIQNLIDEKTLDSQGQLIKNFKIKKFGVDIYCASTNIDPSTLTGSLYGYTIMSVSAEDRMEAALLDGYFSLISLKQSMKDLPINLISEMDAHLQGIYGQYPELFEFLFPEIFAYHQEMSKPVLSQCLSRLVFNGSNFDEAANKNAKEVIVHNAKKLKINPGDAWALYYVTDTYLQLARQHYQANHAKISILAMSKTFK